MQEATNSFDSTNDNIFTFSEKISEKHNVDSNIIINAVKERILSSEDLSYSDAKRFLEKLKDKGHKKFILTYLPKTNQEYQMMKIMGSGLAKYFDGIIMTTEYKFTLDIDYKNGIFIDDDPRDLNGLYDKNPIEVIRIRKPNNKRSKIELDNKNIKEYVSFDDINIEKIKKMKSEDIEK